MQLLTNLQQIIKSNKYFAQLLVEAGSHNFFIQIAHFCLSVKHATLTITNDSKYADTTKLRRTILEKYCSTR